jgi:cytoskeletal protein CcmA (bactofilin family)
LPVWDLTKIMQPQRPFESFSVPFGVVVGGDLTSEIPGRVDGRVNGNIVTKGKLIIGEKAVIDGNISAEQLIIFGMVHGNVEVAGKVVLHDHACVKGSVTASVLEIDETAVVKGLITKSKYLYLNGHGSATAELVIQKRKAEAPLPSKKQSPLPATNGHDAKHRKMNGTPVGPDKEERWF